MYGVYQMGSISPVTDAANTQMFMFVGGKLAGADPGASITNFEQTYPGSAAVSPGPLGGQAACTETHLNGQSASMCVWFDNDTFGDRGVADDDDREAREHHGRGAAEPGAVREVAG